MLASRPSKEAQRAQHAFQEELVPHVKTVLKESIGDLTTKLTSVSSVPSVNTPPQQVQSAQGVIWASLEQLLQASVLIAQLGNTTICEVPQHARRVLLAKHQTHCRVRVKGQHGHFLETANQKYSTSTIRVTTKQNGPAKHVHLV